MGGNEDGESDKSYLMIKHMILEAGDEMMSILTKTKMYKARQALVIKVFSFSQLSLYLFLMSGDKILGWGFQYKSGFDYTWQP